MNETTSLLWFGLFTVAVVGIAADLLIHRRKQEISLRAAIAEIAGWVLLALLFDLWIFQARGREASMQFLAGYLVEQSLSIDNIFIFLLIFHSFRLAPRAQHRVLFYGVAGAIAFRAAFVFGGVALLDHFEGVTYVFAAILLYTAGRMLFARHESLTAQTWPMRLARKILPVAEESSSQQFFVRENGRWMATTLLVALVAVEVTDVVFAADSVPAVLAITRDTFVAYSSNLFAVLGLRAIYFVLAGMLRRIRFLHQGLAGVLLFTGIKMIAGDRLPLSSAVSLAVIGDIFAVTIAASFCWPGHSSTTDRG